MIARPVLRRFALAAVLVAAVGIVAGCGGGSASGALGSGVVANVNGQEITQAQLDEVIKQAQDRLKAQGQKIPAAGSQQYQSFQQNALQYLVQRAQYAQQAEKLGITVTDAQVQKRLDSVIKQYFDGSKAKYQQQLKKQGITDAQVRDDLRAALVSEAIFKKVGGTAKVTDAEIAAYYKAHPEIYNQPPTREVRHILVNSKSLADEIYGKLKSGADFAALAKKYSIDSSKSVGGKLTETKGQFVPQFEKVAWALKVNEISKPVHTQFGWHVIQALSPITPGKVTPLTSVKATIRQTLLSQKQSDLVSQWLAKLKQDYDGKITYASGFAPATTQSTTTTTG
jgi:foldase protein PrsA